MRRARSIRSVDDLLAWQRALAAAKPIRRASRVSCSRDHGHGYGIRLGDPNSVLTPTIRACRRHQRVQRRSRAIIPTMISPSSCSPISRQRRCRRSRAISRRSISVLRRTSPKSFSILPCSPIMSAPIAWAGANSARHAGRRAAFRRNGRARPAGALRQRRSQFYRQTDRLARSVSKPTASNRQAA